MQQGTLEVSVLQVLLERRDQAANDMELSRVQQDLQQQQLIQESLL
jgi:hypothetical protein